LKIESDQPLLSPYLRKKLNPLQITIESFKDVPLKIEPCYKPVYSSLRFVDDSHYKTQEVPQAAACKFNHRHVVLLGLSESTLMRELLETKTVKVFLHDNDEYTENGEQREFSKGLAQFSFRDLLRPHCREVRLRSDVFPTKRQPDDNTQNLDLNSTARKRALALDKLNPYLTCATYCTVKANLAYPITFFDDEKELAKFKDDFT